MGLVQMNFSEDLRREKLDYFLAHGWFRSSFLMYRSPLLCLNETIATVVNIRLNLQDYQAKKRHRKLLRRNNSKYQVTFSPVLITPEAERLYQLNKVKFKGFIHSDLHGYLYANANYTPFESYQIEVHDGDKLIAISFVDVGSNSMASILGLYDPQYAKDSLGIYTMLLEIIEAKSMRLKWYYPGYVVDGDDSFNYKLSLGNYEAMLDNYQWIDYHCFDKNKSLGRRFLAKMDLLYHALKEKTNCKFYIYPHFSIGYVEQYSEANYYNKPAFVLFVKNNLRYIASYDILKNKYTIGIILDEAFVVSIDSEISDDYLDDRYWQELFRQEKLNEYSTLEELMREF